MLVYLLKVLIQVTVWFAGADVGHMFGTSSASDSLLCPFLFSRPPRWNNDIHYYVTTSIDSAYSSKNSLQIQFLSIPVLEIILRQGWKGSRPKNVAKVNE